MKEKKVLIVAANGLGKSGVPNVICQVVTALHNYASFDVVVFNNDNYYNNKIEGFGAKIIKVNEKEPKKPISRLLWRLFVEGFTHKSIFKKLLKNKKYDVIHSFKEYDSAYIFRLSNKYGVKEKIIHCNNQIKPPKNIISKIVFNKKKKMIKRYTTLLLGVSSECCKISYPNMKFELLYNSYDEKVFNLNIKSNLDSNELVLTHVATYSSRKNQLFSLNILRILKTFYPKVKLKMIGFEVEKGYLNKIINYILKYNLYDSVEIIDGSNGISDYFQCTSYLLLPSLHEAAPITLVEAQACGITCFASCEITRDVDCGGVKYLPIDNPDIWAKEIINQFSNSGNNRSNYDVSRFSMERYSKRLKEIYNI